MKNIASIIVNAEYDITYILNTDMAEDVVDDILEKGIEFAEISREDIENLIANERVLAISKGFIGNTHFYCVESVFGDSGNTKYFESKDTYIQEDLDVKVDISRISGNIFETVVLSSNEVSPEIVAGVIYEEFIDDIMNIANNVHLDCICFSDEFREVFKEKIRQAFKNGQKSVRG